MLSAQADILIQATSAKNDSTEHGSLCKHLNQYLLLGNKGCTAAWPTSETPLHSETVWYLSLHSASTLAVLPNLIVQPPWLPQTASEVHVQSRLATTYSTPRNKDLQKSTTAIQRGFASVCVSLGGMNGPHREPGGSPTLHIEAIARHVCPPVPCRPGWTHFCVNSEQSFRRGQNLLEPLGQTYPHTLAVAAGGQWRHRLPASVLSSEQSFAQAAPPTRAAPLLHPATHAKLRTPGSSMIDSGLPTPVDRPDLSIPIYTLTGMIGTDLSGRHRLQCRHGYA